MDTNQFFDSLWADYTAMTPQADQIRTMLQSRGETVVNDHVAFRTIDLNPIKLVSLERPLIQLGYSRSASYHFEDKHLDAWSYTHIDPTQPKVFLSAFDSRSMGSTAETIINRLMKQARRALKKTRYRQNGGNLDLSCFCIGTLLWEPISFDEYNLLAAESEYLAWVAALGLRPNHFTVSINHLETVSSVREIIDLVAESGVPINAAGGTIKGSPAELLEQGSTMASCMDVEFSDGVHSIPTCYYEFARRYPDADGELFQGFVTTSADKIFESTDSSNA